MSFHAYIKDHNNIDVLSVALVNIENYLYCSGYFEYHIDLICSGKTLDVFELYELVFADRVQVCIFKKIIQTNLLNDGKYRVKTLACSPQSLLQSIYKQKSWLKTSIGNIVHDLVSPMQDKFNMRVIIEMQDEKYFFIQRSHNNFKCLYDILQEYNAVVHISMINCVLQFKIISQQEQVINIHDIDAIEISLKQKLNSKEVMLGPYIKKTCRVYKGENNSFSSTKVKELQIIGTKHNIKVGQQVVYNGDRYTVSVIGFCYRTYKGYDLVVNIFLVEDLEINKHQNEGVLLGYAKVEKVYTENNSMFIQSLLDDNRELPLPIMPIISLRNSKTLNVRHSYKRNSTVMVARLYNTDNFIALPCAYDELNKSITSYKEDALLQSTETYLSLSESGIKFYVSSLCQNMTCEQWNINTDKLHYSSERMTIENVEKKIVDVTDMVNFSIKDEMEMESKTITVDAPRINYNSEKIVRDIDNVEAKFDQLLIENKEGQLLIDKLIVNGETLNLSVNNIHVNSSDITLQTSGASIRISRTAIDVSASTVNLGRGFVVYNGVVIN
ncbi:MAG: hypothetical protein HON32_00985 [Francisellaceae bacterium]|jgi:hypothetical protein|nr:hypothetical protein [Francisellaceae bacterium]MBT6538778.1 hypothetical protein [Francisellaceae bacterium]